MMTFFPNQISPVDCELVDRVSAGSTTCSTRPSHTSSSSGIKQINKSTICILRYNRPLDRNNCRSEHCCRRNEHCENVREYVRKRRCLELMQSEQWRNFAPKFFQRLAHSFQARIGLIILEESGHKW